MRKSVARAGVARIIYGMRLRDLFRRKREQPDRRRYDREQDTREQVEGMKRTQRRIKDRPAANDQTGFGAF